MQRITHCINCGHKLGESNTSGKCRRTCKKAFDVPEEKSLTPVPPGVLRKIILASVCEHFNFEERFLLGATRDTRFSRARYAAYYLLMHDAGLNDSAVGKFMCRPNTNIKDAVEIVKRDMNEYRNDLAAITKIYRQKLEERSKTAA